MAVPLNCTWYNIRSENNDLVQIPELSGAFYQPCVEDIGHKIMVHAIPTSDVDEYKGMPLLHEIGPVVIDPKMA